MITAPKKEQEVLKPESVGSAASAPIILRRPAKVAAGKRVGVDAGPLYRIHPTHTAWIEPDEAAGVYPVDWEEGTILLMNLGSTGVHLDKSQVIGHLWEDPWVARESVGSRHPGVARPPPTPATAGADEAGKVPDEYQHLEFTQAEGNLHQSVLGGTPTLTKPREPTVSKPQTLDDRRDLVPEVLRPKTPRGV